LPSDLVGEESPELFQPVAPRSAARMTVVALLGSGLVILATSLARSPGQFLVPQIAHGMLGGSYRRW
jgi:hypothetical protein